MIVPFLYNIYNYVNESPQFLWIFYKFVNFCSKYSMPIIAQEDFFLPIDYYKNKKHSASNDNWNLDFKVPTQKDLDNLISYKISKTIDKKIITKCHSDFKAGISIIKRRNEILENEIDKAINSIENFTKTKIKCIICWAPIKSLSYVCKKRGIKLINYEMSSIRRGQYNCTLGYFSFDTKYSTSQIKKYFKNFNNDNIFQRNELLSIFLSTKNLKYLQDINKSPQYDFGLAGGLKKDVMESSFDHVQFNEICKKLCYLTPENTISFRGHPANPLNCTKYNFDIDTSPNSIEWILNCRRIVSNVSNVGFETMLLGRTSYVLSKDMPFYYKSINDLDHLEESVVDLRYLNYIIFGFFAPMELMFDMKYINWRLTEPSINDIYTHNLNFILNNHNLDKSVFNINAKERLDLILKKVHNIDNYNILTHFDIHINKINNLKEIKNNHENEKKHLNKVIELSQNHINNLENIIVSNKSHIKNLENIIKSNENYINNLKNELNFINEQLKVTINSKSWKITKPLRFITTKIKNTNLANNYKK